MGQGPENRLIIRSAALQYSKYQEGTIMRTYDKFYINGQWVEPIGKGTSDVINPATGEISARVPYGNAEDVDAAVSAARSAFASWSQTSAAERAEFLRKLAAEGEKRNADLTQTIIDELGMPIQNAAAYQVDPLAIICESFANKTQLMEEQKEVGNSVIVNEPIGVCSMINPWNYPIWQMIGKVAPAIAAGCTMVVKAASQTPSHLFIFAEMCDALDCDLLCLSCFMAVVGILAGSSVPIPILIW